MKNLICFSAVSVAFLAIISCNGVDDLSPVVTKIEPSPSVSPSSEAPIIHVSGSPTNDPIEDHEYVEGVRTGIVRFLRFENTGGLGEIILTVELFEEPLPKIVGSLDPLESPAVATLSRSFELREQGTFDVEILAKTESGARAKLVTIAHTWSTP